MIDDDFLFECLFSLVCRKGFLYSDPTMSLPTFIIEGEIILALKSGIFGVGVFYRESLINLFKKIWTDGLKTLNVIAFVVHEAKLTKQTCSIYIYI